MTLAWKGSVLQQRKPYQIALRVCFLTVLMVLFIWPALYNGQPLFFPDTTGYIRGADAGFFKLTHHRTVWSSREGELSNASRPLQGRKSISSIGDKTVLAGRSVYYGALLYCGQLAGRLWPAVLVQAAALLLALSLTLHAFDLFTWPRLGVISLVLAAATPLPFFVSYLMPDVFAAVAILAVAALLAAGHRMSVWAMAGWAALLTAALLFHTSHVLVTVAMLVIGIPGVLLVRAGLAWKAISGIFAALLIAAAGEILFTAVTTKLVGSPPLRPPFVMARMIADGPGYRYLLADCPASGLAICRFVPRIPLLMKVATDRPPSDEILWNMDPAMGIFGAADPATQRRLSNEQFKFAEHTFAFDPSGVLLAWLQDAWQQIRMFTLDDIRIDSGGRDYLTVHVPEPYRKTLQATRLWKGDIPIQALSRVTLSVTILSVLVLVGYLIGSRRRLVRETSGLVFSAMIVAGVIANAIICGTLSTPHHRYEARVIWLVPLTAMLIDQLLQSKAWKGAAASQNENGLKRLRSDCAPEAVAV